MTKGNLLLAARRVAVAIRTSERESIGVLRGNHQLSESILHAREVGKLAPNAGLDALDDIARANVAMLRALRLTCSAHAHLHRDKDELGIPPLAIGDEQPTVPITKPNQGMTPLRRIA